MIRFGDCKCHAQHGFTVKADSLDGICRECRAKSPEACSRAHQKEAAAAEKACAVLPAVTPRIVPAGVQETLWGEVA